MVRVDDRKTTQKNQKGLCSRFAVFLVGEGCVSVRVHDGIESSVFELKGAVIVMLIVC